jgi:hypothetical protein
MTPLLPERHFKPAYSACGDENGAVREIRDQLDDADLSAVLIFVSSGYRLDRLGSALEHGFSVPVFGCTTAGNIGPGGYLHNGIQAVGIIGQSIAVQIHLIAPLNQCQSLVADLGRRIDGTPSKPGARRFGLLLVDGLARLEERLASALHHCLPEIPMIGGSAGDDLLFEHTFVFADGRFIENAAIFALFETTLPFAAIKFHHFVPGDDLLVITEADAQTRTVQEINGEPAALAYASHLGLSIGALSPAVFSRSPLMLKLGNEHYVRSIQCCNDDLSLTFYCAIAKGIVVRIGRAVSPEAAFEQAFAAVRRTVPKPGLVIGCDCILRRLEFEQEGSERQIGGLLEKHKVIGFSTFGEQFNALHMNQTFTGLAIGGEI